MRAQARQLGNFAKVISGYAFKSKDFVDEGIPVLKIANIKHEHVVFDPVQYLPEKFLGIDDKFKVRFGDVMICLTGSHISQPNSVVGRVAMYRHERLALLNQRAGRIVVHDTENLDKDFLYYYLRQERVMYDLALTAGGAANQANISPKDVEKIELPDTDILAQKAISSTLKAYDDLIENNKRRIELLEESARQLYKEWFVRFRFPGHEHVKIIDGVPEGWKKTTLGEVAHNFDRKRVPLSVMEREQRVGIYPYYGAAGILGHIDEFLFDGLYLLMGEDGTVQTKQGVPMLQLVQGKFWVSNHAHVLEGKSVSTEYLYVALSNYQISGHITGVAQPKITQQNMNRIPIIVPNDTLRTEFDEFILSIFKMRFSLDEQIRELSRARDILLPKLISGEIAV